MKQRLLLICLGVLAYVPFHALLSTWAISNFGHESIFKALKDIVVAGVGVSCLVMVARSKVELSPTEKTLAICLGVFLALHLVLLPSSHSTSQAVAGLIVNLRYLIFFGSLYFLTRELRTEVTHKAFRVVVICAVIVTVFGFLQSTFLPNDFLRHFGYGESTILPYQLVDSDESTVRIISTLRGSGTLGAYLVIAIGAFVYSVIQKRRNWIPIVLGTLATGLVLYRTHSRASWLAVVISGFIFSVIHFKSIRKNLLIASSIAAACLLLTIVCFRNSAFVQKIVFHVDPLEASQVDSDDKRLDSLESAFSDISEKPFGHGVGSSGIASFRGNKPYVTENYFLEITYQLGIVGGLLLIVIHLLVLKMLYQNISDPPALILFSSFIGLTVIGLLWPVWSDETVAYTWWGLAGAVLGKLSKKPLK